MEKQKQDNHEDCPCAACDAFWAGRYEEYTRLTELAEEPYPDDWSVYDLGNAGR